jgi:uncharacterized protein (DUF608 family)
MKMYMNKTIKNWPVLTKYTGRNLLRVAMPLGGIGNGALSIGGRGNLCDWEIMNRPGKDFSPWINSENGPFFAVCAKNEKSLTKAKILEGPLDFADFEGPGGPKNQNHGLPRFKNCEFSAAYPFGQVALSSPEFPLEVTLEAFNPLVPADVEASSLPVAVLRYVVKNISDESQDVTVCGSIPNFIGMDGDDRYVSDASKLCFNGDCDNVNSWKDEEDLKGILMSSRDNNNTDKDTWGTIAISTPDDDGIISKRLNWLNEMKWNAPLRDFWDDFTNDGLLDDREQGSVNQPIASLAVKKQIPAGQQAVFTFYLTWHFPNRYDWTPEKHRGENSCRTKVGNYYCSLYDDAWDAAKKIHPQLPELEKRTVAFVQSFVDSDLSQAVKEAALNNISTLRCQTCFRTEDGNFFGYEGSMPHRGSCYGNCTHVWNYEQVTAFLFGDIAKNMRNLEFLYATADNGMMNFRINLPLSDALGFGKAAADGQMGCIMKLYRDWLLSGDDDMLKNLWPKAKKTLEFCWIPNGWDADKDGVMEGCQHNTMDVEYYGPNPQMTGWYLGALKAMSKMAEYLGDIEFSEVCMQLFEQGSRWMDDNLFNGSYYIQKVIPPVGVLPECLHGDSGAKNLSDPDYQLVEGCLVDQLVGQYMAHICGLGYLFEPENVKTTLKSIFKLNRQDELWDHFNTMRTFALCDESALLMAAYPDGKRPRVPFPYYSEVMTGFEYTAAVGMIFEGLEDEGMQCISDIRHRFDGARRSPFDEAECGHHYVRGMASWAAVVALTGFHYNAIEKSWKVGTRLGRFFWSNGYSWGTYELKNNDCGDKELTININEGNLHLKSIHVGNASLNGEWILDSNNLKIVEGLTARNIIA